MVDLIGLPKKDDTGFFAMPMMRGFAAPVMSPMIGGAAANKPQQGVGVGMSNVPGKGALFFLSIHGDQDDTLVAQLDYARYRRLCELLASVGKQALMIPGVEEPARDDPLAALGLGHPAIAAALLAYGEQRVMTQAEAQECADAFNAIGRALGVPEDAGKGEAVDGVA